MKNDVKLTLRISADDMVLLRSHTKATRLSQSAYTRSLIHSRVPKAYPPEPFFQIMPTLCQIAGDMTAIAATAQVEPRIGCADFSGKLGWNFQRGRPQVDPAPCKDLEFVGIVFANNVMKIDGKDTMGMIAANVCKETFGADCVLLNKSGMGHCQLDSALAFNWCQKLDMPAVLNLSAVSNDEPGDMLVIADPSVDAVINSGRNYDLEHPRVERLIGENSNVPCLLGYDPWGPFTHTTNFAYQGIWSQLGDCYVTTDSDMEQEGD